MEYLDKNGKPLKKGDVVEWGAGHKGTVVELSSFGIRVQGYGIRGLEEWTGGSSQVRKVSNSASTNPVVQNALAAQGVARNAQHFHGDADALAQKIALQYNKWSDAPERRKDDEFNKLNTLIRTASSLGGGVWVMRDGTIAIVNIQPRGAKPISDFI